MFQRPRRNAIGGHGNGVKSQKHALAMARSVVSTLAIADNCYSEFTKYHSRFTNPAIPPTAEAAASVAVEVSEQVSV
ncbi:MAG: hypothetical protein DME98_13045 [Verrucomicrobia bacterium]|jgi:hypothetical protein|nr:MAG: hypothetical protein DME98_13045 [Verrucomicrobiota bacterium]PYJ32650.1 MAG: hypothetical protein DME88_10235 [Verrucomicrobiota bacterium]